MRIRVKKNFSVYKQGQEFDWSDGMARLLLARGLIEQIPDAPKTPEVEEATTQPVVERAVERHTKRPRK